MAGTREERAEAPRDSQVAATDSAHGLSDRLAGFPCLRKQHNRCTSGHLGSRVPRLRAVACRNSAKSASRSGRHLGDDHASWLVGRLLASTSPIAHAQGGGMMAALRDVSSIDICVCTFRRPELVATLRSLDALKIPSGFRVSIIVADNDNFPTAEPLAAKARAQSRRLPIRYVHCPARTYRLHGMHVLTPVQPLRSFIDDDETASNVWLEQLVRVAQTSGADAVLGPVRAVYRPDAPNWMRRGDFHSTRPVWVAGEIRTGYTCNVLLRMSANSVRGRRFSLARGKSGGEDTEFFHQVCNLGGRITFADDAWVEEPVTPPVRRSVAGPPSFSDGPNLWQTHRG